ncbi:OmpA/MotB [Reinekea sp. MED297]|uniref:OmpA/MotB n=2 Tax=Reinekea TaxID=230494 RepID=A4BCW0_9GAMM|nr:OmpA/MotB [Reinekea sp. MED297] [Reinekea blandensis MED297]
MSLIGLTSVHTFAHDSIAAQMVVADPELVWKAWDAEEDGPLETADAQFKSGWYVGGGTGLTEVSPEGSSGGFYVEDDRDWGYKVFAGWRFMSHWGAEISYVYTGEAGLGNVNPAIADDIADATIRYQIPTMAASYYLRGAEHPLDVFGRVGLSAITNSVSDDRIPYEKQTPVQLNLGIGVEWRINETWFARAAYDGFDNDASMLAISLGRYFTRHPDHRALPEPTPIPEPAAPEPITPPEPVCAEFNGAIDAIQFAVDSAQLNDTSRVRLQEAANTLRQFPDINIQIEAHTDSTASEAYNLSLSDQRAQAIRDYLIELGIDEQRLTATGYGESQPRASNESEEGRSLNRRVEFRMEDTSPCSMETVNTEESNS